MLVYMIFNMNLYVGVLEVEGKWTSQNFETQDINMGELVAIIYCFYKFLSDFGYVYILWWDGKKEVLYNKAFYLIPFSD